MLPTFVALVPGEGVLGAGDDMLEIGELLHVAASLQTQVTRDLAPLWGVMSIVSPFPAVTHVPPSYIPLVITRPGGLTGANRLGFHIAADGQPIGLVEYGPGWSLLASHELIEILVDPWGMRSIRGTSVGDGKLAKVGPARVVAGGAAYAAQGQVNYLVEVCDPCQHSTYTINGVLVSDFVTPQYYDPLGGTGARYCYTGRIKASRQLLQGGYITWHASQPEAGIWQAYAEMGSHDEPAPVGVEALTVAPLSGISATLSRQWVDSRSPADGRPEVEQQLAQAGLLKDASESCALAVASARAYGEQIKDEVAEVMAALANAPNLEGIKKLLAALADASDPTIRTEYAENPGAVLDRYGIERPSDLVQRAAPLPSAAEYQAALDMLTGGDRFGPLDGVYTVSQWISTLGVFGR